MLVLLFYKIFMVYLLLTKVGCISASSSDNSGKCSENRRNIFNVLVIIVKLGREASCSVDNIQHAAFTPGPSITE